MPISDQVMRDLRDVARAVTPGDVSAMGPSERLVFRVLPALLDEVESLRDGTVQRDFVTLYEAARLVTSALQTSAPTSDVELLAHHVRRTAPLYDELRAEAHCAREALRYDIGRATGRRPHTVRPLPFVLQGAVPMRPGDAERLDSPTLDEVQRRPSLLPDGDAVSLPLGPVLRRRTDALVARGMVGRSLASAVQTLFILGLLEAEGLTPEVYVGEPVQHVSVDAAFVRFALPHDPHSPRRAEVLRDVFAWMHAWLGDDDPLSAAPAAALAALSRP